MFRENNSHLQPELFNSMTDMNPKIQEKLLNSWAHLYYEHVFCKIDESLFAPLYHKESGRPNFPVNILLSLEFIKHFKNYTDEDVLEQFYYNYQIMHAVGIRQLGDLHLAPRTLYEFRERVYRFALINPGQEDLVFQQFDKLTEHFIQVANINTSEQRMDSTLITPNIKRAGRLSLAFDVLSQGVKATPKELLTDKLRQVLEPNFKTNVLYRSKGAELKSRLQEMLDLCYLLEQLLVPNPKYHDIPEIQLILRFLKEQADYNQVEDTWVAKENEKIAASSLQSAYDHDATYRQKGNKKVSGYVENITETCATDNPVQFITDYTLKQNNKNDTEILQERLPGIKKRTQVEDLYVDGGYYGDKTNETAEATNVTMHYTNMTGTRIKQGKLPLTAFRIRDYKEITRCPAECVPFRAHYDQEKEILSAHFSLGDCKQCPFMQQCPVKLQKKDAVLRISKKSIKTAEARSKISSERRENTSKRAAIEGTNSALKRSHGASKLRVRGQVKSAIVTGMQAIGHNIQQLVHYFKTLGKKALAVPVIPPNNGILIPNC